MTFLPVVARELRVAARRSATYWTRFLVAGAAVLVGLWIFAFTVGVSLGLKPEEIAHFIFMGISAIGLIYGLVAGRRFTADCLSSEKREGTLGLLFLTDLTGYDVVFGKLAATSLTGFFGLLAVVPVMGMPMMMGGVSWQEVWRMALVLLNTFFFSLAAGIFVSALTRDARKAFGANFGLLLVVTAGPPAKAMEVVAWT
jgi:ABC-type transport system involved in cytochrome c biogenesis permease component